MQKFVRIENVGQVFATKKGPFVALRDIDLTVAQGEFISLIGHSGCGKSTLLNLVAGLTRPTSGVLLCAEKEITGPGPDRAVVFQNHSLLPWLTCYENVHLAVERVFAATESREQCKARTLAALELVGLAHAQGKLPREISGGMKQRVGIARALAIEPKVLLMDEPFGALDALTRAHLQDELLKIVAKTHSTTIMVTHDVDEAVLLSDRIVMLSNGPAATIGEILEVALPRPRDRVALANDGDYLAYRAAVVDFLHRRHGNPAAQADAAAAAQRAGADAPAVIAAGTASASTVAESPAMSTTAPAAILAAASDADAGVESDADVPARSGVAALPQPSSSDSLATTAVAPATVGAYVAGSDAPEKTTLRVGYIPLADCATVALCAELGFDRRYGLRIEPVKQASWSMVRDGLCGGALDASHALYSMVYGTHLGVGGAATPMAILMGLNHNGQGITLTRALAERGVRDGWSLARAVRGGESLTLAHTFATGTHAMWLAYWLAAHGIDPARDVDRVVVPPPRTVSTLQDGLVHGFCVGEPWLSLAAQAGAGFTVATTQSIWADHPEKVLAATDDWVARHPNSARALVAALIDTARYLDETGHRDAVARRLAQPDLIGQGADALVACLDGRGSDGLGHRWVERHPLSFYGDGKVTFPYESDGIWFLTQFVRWGLLRSEPDYRAVVRAVQRNALYAQAAALAGAPVPDTPDRDVTFFDGQVFRANEASAYARGFPIAAAPATAGPSPSQALPAGA